MVLHVLESQKISIFVASWIYFSSLHIKVAHGASMDSSTRIQIQPVSIYFHFFVIGCLVRYTPPDFFTCLVYAKGTNVFCQKVTFLPILCTCCGKANTADINSMSQLMLLGRQWILGRNNKSAGGISYHYAYYALHIIFTYPSE